MPVSVGQGTPSGNVKASGTITVTAAGVPHRFTTGNVSCSVVFLSADLGNTEGPMVVGDSNVVAASGAQRGVVIIPGNAPVPIAIGNLNLLYVDAMTNGDKLCYIVIG